MRVGDPLEGTMTRIVSAFLFLLASLGLISSAASAPAPRPRAAPLSPLAHYRFNGDGKDATKANPDFELKNTSFKDNALYLNGVYQFGGGKANNGYRAVCKTARLDYSAFSVALRFKAEEFDFRKINLLTGGTSYRWF